MRREDRKRQSSSRNKRTSQKEVTWHRVFVLERIERERRDLVDFEGLAWGGPLTLIGLA